MKRDVKDVLLSIKPYWISKIISGEKTVEIRKSEPKMIWISHFKVYMYSTAHEMRLCEIIRDGDDIYGDTYHGKPLFITTFKHGDGLGIREKMIVGEFTCDCIEHLCNLFEGEPLYHLPQYGDCCLTMDELEKYGAGKKLYGWHITNARLYKVPKPLSEFGLKRPPQSWCYAERCARAAKGGRKWLNRNVNSLALAAGRGLKHGSEWKTSDVIITDLYAQSAD